MERPATAYPRLFAEPRVSRIHAQPVPTSEDRPSLTITRNVELDDPSTSVATRTPPRKRMPAPHAAAASPVGTSPHACHTPSISSSSMAIPAEMTHWPRADANAPAPMLASMLGLRPIPCVDEGGSDTRMQFDTSEIEMRGSMTSPPRGERDVMEHSTPSLRVPELARSGDVSGGLLQEARGNGAASASPVRFPRPAAFVISPPAHRRSNARQHVMDSSDGGRQLYDHEHASDDGRATDTQLQASPSPNRADALPLPASPPTEPASTSHTPTPPPPAGATASSRRSALEAAVFGDVQPDVHLPRTGGFGGRVPIAPPRAPPPDIGIPVELLALPAAARARAAAPVEESSPPGSPERGAGTIASGSDASESRPSAAVRFDVDVAPPKSSLRPSLGGPRSGLKPPRGHSNGTPAAPHVSYVAGTASVVSDVTSVAASERSRIAAAAAVAALRSPEDSSEGAPPSRVARTVSRASDRSAASSAPRRSVSATGRGSGTTTVANKQRIVNALSTVCLAGAHRTTELAACMIALEAASAHTDAFLILVTAPDSTSYRALYTLSISTGECIKVHGAGPVELTPLIRQSMGLEDPPARGAAEAPALTACFKYSTSQRCFQQLPSMLVGLTTDAISIRLPRRR